MTATPDPRRLDPDAAAEALTQARTLTLTAVDHSNPRQAHGDPLTVAERAALLMAHAQVQATIALAEEQRTATMVALLGAGLTRAAQVELVDIALGRLGLTAFEASR